MIVFADSSALVTRYASEQCQADQGPAREIIVSALVRVEVPSALWRKHRMGELPAEDVALLVAAFEADYLGTDGFAVVPVRSAILTRAARLVAAHPLKGYDAIQLATVLTVADRIPECAGFAVLDRQLRVAALAEGLTVFPAP